MDTDFNWRRVNPFIKARALKSEKRNEGKREKSRGDGMLKLLLGHWHVHRKKPFIPTEGELIAEGHDDRNPVNRINPLYEATDSDEISSVLSSKHDSKHSDSALDTSDARNSEIEGNENRRKEEQTSDTNNLTENKHPKISTEVSRNEEINDITNRKDIPVQSENSASGGDDRKTFSEVDTKQFLTEEPSTSAFRTGVKKVVFIENSSDAIDNNDDSNQTENGGNTSMEKNEKDLPEVCHSDENREESEEHDRGTKDIKTAGTSKASHSLGEDIPGDDDSTSNKRVTPKSEAHDVTTKGCGKGKVSTTTTQSREDTKSKSTPASGETSINEGSNSKETLTESSPDETKKMDTFFEKEVNGVERVKSDENSEISKSQVLVESNSNKKGLKGLKVRARAIDELIKKFQAQSPEPINYKNTKPAEVNEKKLLEPKNIARRPEDRQRVAVSKYEEPLTPPTSGLPPKIEFPPSPSNPPDNNLQPKHGLEEDTNETKAGHEARKEQDVIKNAVTAIRSSLHPDGIKDPGKVKASDKEETKLSSAREAPTSKFKKNAKASVSRNFDKHNSDSQPNTSSMLSSIERREIQPTKTISGETTEVNATKNKPVRNPVKKISKSEPVKVIKSLVTSKELKDSAKDQIASQGTTVADSSDAEFVKRLHQNEEVDAVESSIGSLVESKAKKSDPKPREGITRNDESPKMTSELKVSQPNIQKVTSRVIADKSLKNENNIIKSQSEDSGITRGDQISSDSQVSGKLQQSEDSHKNKSEPTNAASEKTEKPKSGHTSNKVKSNHPKERKRFSKHDRTCKHCKRLRHDHQDFLRLTKGKCDDYYEKVIKDGLPTHHHHVRRPDSWASDMSWDEFVEREYMVRLRRDEHILNNYRRNSLNKSFKRRLEKGPRVFTDPYPSHPYTDQMKTFDYTDRHHKDKSYHRMHRRQKSLSDDNSSLHFSPYYHRPPSICSCEDCWLDSQFSQANFGRSSVRSRMTNVDYNGVCTCDVGHDIFANRRKVKFAENMGVHNATGTDHNPGDYNNTESQEAKTTPLGSVDGQSSLSDGSSRTSSSPEEKSDKKNAAGNGLKNETGKIANGVKKPNKTQSDEEQYRPQPWELEEWDRLMRQRLLKKRRRRALCMGIMALAMMVFVGLVVAIVMVYLRRKML